MLIPCGVHTDSAVKAVIAGDGLLMVLGEQAVAVDRRIVNTANVQSVLQLVALGFVVLHFGVVEGIAAVVVIAAAYMHVNMRTKERYLWSLCLMFPVSSSGTV